jgi:hypothetical protein
VCVYTQQAKSYSRHEQGKITNFVETTFLSIAFHRLTTYLRIEEIVYIYKLCVSRQFKYYMLHIKHTRKPSLTLTPTLARPQLTHVK